MLLIHSSQCASATRRTQLITDTFTINAFFIQPAYSHVFDDWYFWRRCHVQRTEDAVQTDGSVLLFFVQCSNKLQLLNSKA